MACHCDHVIEDHENEDENEVGPCQVPDCDCVMYEEADEDEDA